MKNEREGNKSSSSKPFLPFHSHPLICHFPSLQPSKSNLPMAQTVSLKLLVDTTKDKVVFAEAGKDFVDFLFGLLQLPLGGILAALRGQSVAGSTSKIYESVQNLANDYLQSNQTKQSLLQPVTATSNTEPSPLLKELPFSFQSNQTKQSLLQPVTATSNTEPSPLLKELPFSFQPRSTTYGPYDGRSREVPQGYVKSAVVYTVADDLTVEPLSTVSSVALLNSLKVKDISVLQEKIVEVDMDKGLKLLKASLESTTVLTDVFL